MLPTPRGRGKAGSNKARDPPSSKKRGQVTEEPPRPQRTSRRTTAKPPAKAGGTEKEGGRASDMDIDPSLPPAHIGE